ncbi:hypothetical protein GGS20DRAFT_599017 [Poronia punctata]|nr:hypothetical protein GGS20DRAFT_599017 [Poronia punctata]
MTREVSVAVFPTPPEALVERLLRYHQPYSLPLARRLQFTNQPGGITDYSRILFASTEPLAATAGDDTRIPFAAAYLDLSRAPDTEMWVYSSIERQQRLPSEEEDEEETSCAISLFQQVKRECAVYFASTQKKRDKVLIGTLNENLRERLPARTGVELKTIWDKWIFRSDLLPDVKLPELLGEEGRRWYFDTVRKEDVAFAISRSHIPRQDTALYLDEGTPIAWAFLGPDSSIMTLYCEEAYRNQGIAKAVIVKTLRDRLNIFGDNGPQTYGWADVAPDNVQSQGVCRGLRGEVSWRVSWSWLDLEKVSPEK